MGGRSRLLVDAALVGYLPAGAESKAVVELSERFAGQDATPAIVDKVVLADAALLLGSWFTTGLSWHTRLLRTVPQAA